MDETWMREALAEAEAALRAGEAPVGCVIVRSQEVIARARNRREELRDPTAHAEILALREAAARVGNWRLSDCTAYVTLEPCPMCAGALLNARVGRVVFGAYDPAQGCAGSVYRLLEDPAFSWFAPCDGGVLEQDCARLLRAFFQARRG